MTSGAGRSIFAARCPLLFRCLGRVLAAVHGRLIPGGLFVFSLEEASSELRTRTATGNGKWALGPQGRYAHSLVYLERAAPRRRVSRSGKPSGRRCAGRRARPVEGLLVVLERVRDDG